MFGKKNDEKSPLDLEQYMVIMKWYPCDGEDRWCTDCKKPSFLYSAVYHLTFEKGKKDPKTGYLDEISAPYWGVVKKCHDCKLHIWIDKNNVEKKRTYPPKKKEN